jgi:hypothetical protein
VARHRSDYRQFQLSYTWSHLIDNQSDPLAGDFFDLSFTRVTGGDNGGRATFSRQFDPVADRGNSDFDQRHNLVFLSILESPAWLRRHWAGHLIRNWRFSQLAAFRTGFPYSVEAISTAQNSTGLILNNRADIADPNRLRPEKPVDVPGGKRLLIPAGFSQPGLGMLGNSGRNAFGAPGFYNIDLSLSRSFGLPWIGEGGRFTVRADAFNVLNHANLGSPDTLITSDTFGVATYGRQGRQSGFPAVTPFVETARQVQLMLRLEF